MYMKIAERILSQAACPRCGGSLRDCAYDILSANNESMMLELDCAECNSVLTANGVFQKKTRANMPMRHMNKAQKLVSPETVRGIGSALRTFQGQDIQDLLKK